MLQVVKEMGRQLSTHVQQLAALVKFTAVRNIQAFAHRRDKGFMNQFPIAVTTEHFTAEQLQAAIPVYQALIDGELDDDSMGICWNAQAASNGVWGVDVFSEKWFCMYGLTGKLFDAIRATDRAYPIKHGPLRDAWASRKEWCQVFANGLKSGTLEVSDTLLDTLHERGWEDDE